MKEIPRPVFSGFIFCLLLCLLLCCASSLASTISFIKISAPALFIAFPLRSSVRKQKLIAGSFVLLARGVLAGSLKSSSGTGARGAHSKIANPAGPVQRELFLRHATNTLGSQFCRLSAVPTGKRLVITHVSTSVGVSNGMLPNCNIQSNFYGSQYASAIFTGLRAPGGRLHQDFQSIKTRRCSSARATSSAPAWITRRDNRRLLARPQPTLLPQENRQTGSSIARYPGPSARPVVSSPQGRGQAYPKPAAGVDFQT